MAKTEAPASAPTFSFGGRTFAPVAHTEITLDVAGARASGGETLPLPAMFDYGFSVVEKPEGFFIPTAVYQEGRDAYWARMGQPSKTSPMSASDVKGKLRDAFKKWQGDDAAKKAVHLGFATRTGKEGIEGVTEPGVTFWVLKAQA